MTPTDNAALVARPGWYAHRFDPERDLYHLIPATRAELSAATFLTDANLPGHARAIPAARGPAVAAARAGAPVHFLLHSAFCCSTLLARALDREGTALSLKEPVILNDLAGWRARGGPAAQLAQAIDHGLRVMAQPAGVGEAALVKPSNLVNPLAPAMMALRGEARAIVLHAPLPTFLASVASKGLEGRLWVRDLWLKLLGLGYDAFGFGSDELFRHTDLQVAALGWLAQHRAFADLARRFPDRVRTLSSDRLLADPARALAAASRHYALGWTDEALAAVAAGPLFTRHAKTGEAFGPAERAAIHARAADANAEEIDTVQRWAWVVATSAGVAPDLPLPLIP